MEDITQLVQALQSHAWYPVAGIGVALALKIITLRTDWLFTRLPQKLQWIPAATLMVGGAFVDAFRSGATWPVAIVLAAYAALSGTPMAIGTHHLGKRLIPALNVTRKVTRKGRVITALLLMLALPAGTVGCAALPASVAASLPAIFSALGTAEAAVNTFEAWANRFKGAPGVTPELLASVHQLSAECRKSLAESRELARRGAGFEEQATAALNQALDTFEALKGTLRKAGLFNGARLIHPPDGRALGPDELEVTLPPRRL